MGTPADERTTLVLLHAYPLNSAQWMPQRSALHEHLRVYTPDFPGFGPQPGLDEQSMTMERAAEFVHRELEAHDIERCILGGLSMGGYVAFECWRRFPEKISGMILADTRAGADSDEGRRARFAAVERIAGGGYAEYTEELLVKLLSRHTLGTNPDVVDAVRVMMHTTLPQSAIAALLGMAERRDSTDLLGEITVPVAVVSGNDDALISVDEARTMAEAIPDAVLTVIEGAGHIANLEAPELFNNAISNLVERVQSIPANS
jgi:pimeloyl-ACP methyl ester carboxylesterase